MNRALLAAVLLGACAPAPTEAPIPDQPSPPSIEAWIEDRKGGTDLVIQTLLDRDQADLLPEVRPPRGVTLQEGQTTTERAGSWQLQTFRYRVGGQAGHHTLADICLPTTPQPRCASPVFLDLSVPGMTEDMADIVEPAPVGAPVPWLLLGLIGLGAGGVATLLTWWFTRSRPSQQAAPAAPPPPHEVALARWEQLRQDPHLDPMARAVGLSEITRVYLDACLSFPAAKWSTSEILNHLQQLTALPEGNVPRVRRLLRATDRVKYAEEPPGESFFEELDADLRALIDSTRPRTWSEDASPAAAEEGAP